MARPRGVGKRSNVINLSSVVFAMPRLTDEVERRRLERLAERLAVELRRDRTVVSSSDFVEDVEFWRRAARLAGRRIQLHVRTGLSRDGGKVWATEVP